jgi:hypothetical protein
MTEKLLGSVEISNWMAFFGRMGGVYCRTILQPTWEEYGACKEPWQAMAFFLNGYAFERQGRNPSYAPAAVDAIKGNSDLLHGNLSGQVEMDLWADYKLRLGGKDLNEKVCPLDPTGSKSVFARLRERNENNMVTLTSRLMVSDINDAHEFIKSIRGSGPKIASFFLRDIKDISSMRSIDPAKRYLLQPIDTWIWRTVKILQGTQDYPPLSGADDKEKKAVAQFIVNASDDPERVNMGMWYFSARVCGSGYRHGRLLENIQNAEDGWQGYAKAREQELKNLRQ